MKRLFNDGTHPLASSARRGTVWCTRPLRYGWMVFSAQLWLLAAFLAVSIAVAGAKALISGTESRAVSGVLAIAGVALFPLAWHSVARLLDRADAMFVSDPSAAQSCDADAPRRELRVSLLR